MKADILIKNGHLFDPAAGISETGDIAVVNGHILSDPSTVHSAREVIDASGCLVVPGLIDTHVHVFDSGGELGVGADAALLPMGVTTALDFGSAGYANFGDYMRVCVQRSTVRVLSFINVSPTGPVSLRVSEDVNPRAFDKKSLDAWLRQYPNETLGLKIRMGKETIGDMGSTPLEETIKLAQELGCRVAVHVSNSTVPVREMAQLLRPGDVFCHVYQDRGDSIVDAQGHVYPEIRAARERGVLFDVAHGMRNASNEIARKALADGFKPDFIGTDLSSFVAYRTGVVGLPFLMSKFMAMGLSLEEVVTMCTATPAHWLGLDGVIGTLRPGAAGDITVLRRIPRKIVCRDYHGDAVCSDEVLTPELTVRAGRVMYRQVGFDAN